MKSARVRAHRARLITAIVTATVAVALVGSMTVAPAFAEEVASEPAVSQPAASGPEPVPSDPAPAPSDSAPAPSDPAPAPSDPAPAPSDPAPAPSDPPPTMPAPPGANTTWSNGDGSAPSQEWFDAWAQMQQLASEGTSRPATDRNILMPWESSSGQVEWGQGQAVTGGWSYVNPDGSAGHASIVCGSYCASGWIPTTFGSDGVPTGWQRVIQQTVPSETGNVAGANSVYRPSTGWVVESQAGTFAWDWQTNTVGPCIANCAPPPTDPVDPGAPGSGDATTTTPGDPADATITVSGDTAVVLARAARATSVTQESSGSFAVRVVNAKLRPGQVVVVTVTRKGKPPVTWRKKVTKAGAFAMSLPAAWKGAKLTVRAQGALIGVSSIKV